MQIKQWLIEWLEKQDTSHLSKFCYYITGFYHSRNSIEVSFQLKLIIFNKLIYIFLKIFNRYDLKLLIHMIKILIFMYVQMNWKYLKKQKIKKNLMK